MKYKRLFSILLSLMVMISMCFAGTAGVFAGTEPEEGAELVSAEEFAEAVETEDLGEAVLESEPVDEFADYTAGVEASGIELPSYSTVIPANINKEESEGYSTPYYSSSNYFYYDVNMPSAGTLILMQKSSAGNSVSPSVKDAAGNSIYSTGSQTYDNGVSVRTFYIPSAQTVTVNYYVYSNDLIDFTVYYAPNTTNTITAPTTKFSSVYTHASTGDGKTVTKFKVKVSADGYLALDIADGLGTSSVNIKTTGFKDYEYLNSKDIRRYIGVKKGTYTISVKTYAPLYDVKVRLYKVKQAKYGTSKKKAVSLKAKKTYKGLIITNAKKVHWYKFKNTKLHKVIVTIKAKGNDGGYVGAYKVTLYDKKGSIGSSTIYGDTASKAINPYTIGKGNKLVKGTYWIKVESYKGGNGYFSVYWK